MNTVAAPAAQVQRKTLHRTVIRACGTCQAPGVYRNEDTLPGVSTKWPECHAEGTGHKDGEPVGAFCPRCSALRPADEIMPVIPIERAA